MRLLLALMVITMPAHGIIVKETAIKYTEELINGQVFKARSDITNGVLTERKAINDKQVTDAEFEKEREIAFNTEAQKKREQEESTRRQQELQETQRQAFNYKSRLAILNKQISLLIKEIEHELERIKSQSLDQYLVFDDATISSRQHYEDIERVLLPSARTLIAAETPTDIELSGMVKRLEKLPDALRRLSQSVITQAISKSDDTKLLKELLNMVN